MGEQLDCAHVGTHAYVHRFHMYTHSNPTLGLEEGLNPQAFCLISQGQRKAHRKKINKQPKNSEKKSTRKTPKPNLYNNSNSTNPPSQLKPSWLWLLTPEMSRRFSHQTLLLSFWHSLRKGTMSQPHSQPPLNPGGALRCPQTTELPPLNLDRKE